MNKLNENVHLNGNSGAKSNIIGFIVLILSIISTPYILFISTSGSLYIKNQEDLAYQLHVIIPFFVLFFALSVFGFILYFIFRTFNNFFPRLLLWGYLLLGPGFLVFNVLKHKFSNLLNSSIGVILFILSFFIIIILFQNKGNLKHAKIIISAICLSIVLSDGFSFITNYNSKISHDNDFLFKTPIRLNKNVKMPNVYHIVLDEFQTDMFELTLSKGVIKKLNGFVFYPENTTLFGRTRMSFASTFLSKFYDYKRPQIEYQMAGFNSKESFLFWLVNSGYETFAIMHPIFKYDLNLLHHKISHADFVSTPFFQDNSNMFNKLWVFAYLPEVIANNFILSADYDQFKNQNFLSNAAPILSYLSFRKYLNLEKDLSEYNRYVFLHLLIPHFPNVLNCDCKFGEPTKNGDIPFTSPLEQSTCATKIIIDFIDKLKELNRFENSFIIIHGDHGSRYKVKNNKLFHIKSDYYSREWSRARSHSLLLIKYPGKNTSYSKLIISPLETTLLDIAPTLYDVLDINPDISVEGLSLVNNNSQSFLKREKRYYHFYDKKGWHGWTDEMTRFLIKDKKIKKEKIIKLNDPKPKKGKQIYFPWKNKSSFPTKKK